LLYPEHRWSEHLKEEQETKLRSGSLLSATHPKETLTPKAATISHPDRHTISRSVSESIESVTKFENFASSNDSDPAPSASDSHMLPVLALNEVFIGESLSSRVSYYELGINKGNTIKQKSSGFTVCTGTGSTSWYFNINKLTDQCVGELVNIIGSELKVDLPKTDPAMVSRICKRFNDQLLFSPDHPRMAYTVRDPVYNATFPPVAPRGFADSITVKSRCFDAHLVVDGGLSYIFNDGSEATLAI
uniref:Uncharacterized protein n=1 Tax=Plectus sambesii TaxID=2011161 RepID=A0A914ULU5_9BILA